MEIDPEKLKDPVWRLHNLYAVRPTDGVVRPFVPNRMQARIIDEVYRKGHKRILIPKSRRYGCSTLIGIMQVDANAFRSGVKLALVDLTQPSAIEKMNSIMALAVESLREKIPGVWDYELQKGKLTLRAKGKDPSTIYAGKSFRGDGVCFAHISEIGAIAANEPARALEIKNATLPAAEGGIVIIETTVRGGKRGVFWDLVKGAQEMEEEYKGPLDWRILFLPWFDDPKNVDDGAAPLMDGTREYFEKLERVTGRRFTQEQKRWWQREKRNFGATMGEEYPSTIEEAFEVPQGGAILAKSLDEADMEGRIRRVVYDMTKLCWGSWDLGAPQNTVCAIFQLVDGVKYVLKVDCGLENETPALRTARILREFPTLSYNIFPHDAGYVTHTGFTQEQLWTRAGLPGIRVVPKTSDKWIGINGLLGTFRTYVWDEEGTRDCRGMMMGYRMIPRLGEDGRYKNEIVHNESSHWADPIRMIAEAELRGMLTGGGGVGGGRVRVTFGKLFRQKDRYA